MNENVSAKDLLKNEIGNGVVKALLAYSDVSEKGRTFSSAAFMHLLHEVLPAEIQKALSKYEIYKKGGK